MAFPRLLGRDGIAAAAILATLTLAAAASPGSVPSRSPGIELPDGKWLSLPPGTRAFGPQGPVTVQPKAAEAPPEPPVSPTERRRRSLDELYDRLASARDAQEAGSITARIAAVQEVSASDTANLLMQRASTAIAAKDNATALAVLDKLVALQPRWAEAWNKRATVRYLNDDDIGSMDDISHVLALQPRHFGALSGMGMILHRNGEDKAAMTVFKQAAAINPQDESVKALIEQLRPAAEGIEL